MPKGECQVCGGDGIICSDHPWQPWDNWHQLHCSEGKLCTCKKPLKFDDWSEEEIQRCVDRFNTKDRP